MAARASAARQEAAADRDVAVEVLARTAGDLRAEGVVPTRHRDVHGIELVAERRPPDARLLREHELQVGVALEDAREDEEVSGAPAEPPAALDRDERDELRARLHARVARAGVGGERQPQFCGRGPERLPGPVVVGADPRPRRREVHPLEPGVPRPAQLGHGGVDVPDRKVREPDVAVRLGRAHGGQPTVVDADARRRELGVVRRAEHRGLERDRFVVLAAVEDHLGGDTLEVEVATPRDRIVVTGGCPVPPR